MQPIAEPPASQPNGQRPKRRWFQYSLRSLLVLVTLFAIACSWYAVEMQKAAKRRAAIAEITKVGGPVFYYDASDPDTLGKPPRWFSWLRRLHGDEHLGNAVVADLSSFPMTDAGPEYLKELTSLQYLSLEVTETTDAGLVHLKGLTNLKGLPPKISKNPVEVWPEVVNHLETVCTMGLRARRIHGFSNFSTGSEAHRTTPYFCPACR